ncbi:unnamed protein product [Caenorhabditis auriculariae]|uniref:Uncharacterized protein n=1 Tax=Caenorhabditis auriculariae TaxID=2777116 RepID=A0A8S1H0U8_9PELO|nr:unnamed protein product [Caenorhabditis auriculariae]
MATKSFWSLFYLLAHLGLPSLANLSPRITRNQINFTCFATPITRWSELTALRSYYEVDKAATFLPVTFSSPRSSGAAFLSELITKKNVEQNQLRLLRNSYHALVRAYGYE